MPLHEIAADNEKGTCKRCCTSAMTVRGDYEHTEIVFQEAFLQEECGSPKRGKHTWESSRAVCFREASVGARFIFVYF